MMKHELRSRASKLTAVSLAVMLAAGCSTDNVLRIKDPDVSRPPDVTGKSALPALLATAVGDFQVAYSGTGGTTGFEGLVNMSGLFTDEFFFSETFPTRVVVDRRDIAPVNSTLRDIFFNVQRARASARRAAIAYAEFAPDDSSYAEVLALEGYTYILFAEVYCSGVPVSSFDAEGNVLPGLPLNTKQLLDTAILRFTTARQIATATGSDYLENLARVGQARALVFQNSSNLAAAAALVANVPSDFVYRIFSSENTDRQNNGVFEFNWNEARWTQADKEGTNGLAFRNGDPRTPFEDLGLGFDNKTELYGTLKYADRNASVVLASGTEARLIEAEAALAAGNPGLFVNTLNALRATQSGLTALTDPGTATGRVDLLFRERAYWLFLTGHRLGDLRRLARPIAQGGYGRSAESVFPTGTYKGRGGGVYGTDVNFPIPVEEENNPNFNGCLDRNP